MKKLVLIGTMAVTLSGCQLIEQITGGVSTSSENNPVATTTTPEQQQKMQKLDAQYERVKKNGKVIEFNGEKYIKSTKAVKGKDPYFVSLAVSENRNIRKSISSQTIYLSDPSKEAETTEHFLKSSREVCNLQQLTAGSQTYYACNENASQRFIALVHKEKNIMAYRSYTSYQQIPTDVEELSIVQSLATYPLDTIGR